jgi:hypothetical protein
MMNDKVTGSAASFLWTSGRVLEQRRFAYLFGGQTAPSGVLSALEAYRSPDGGYAYGLEPDTRGPAAQPISVPAALRVLAETGSLTGARAAEICDWLARHTAANGGVPAVLPSLRPYPHPPWLPVSDEPAGDLLATGQIAGPLLGAGVSHPWLETATAFCRDAIEQLDQTHPYEAEAAVAFLDGTADRAWTGRQARRLGELVRDQRIVLLDPDNPGQARLSPGYGEGEYHLPHDYARQPDSLARGWFTDAEIDRSLEHLAASQQDDGGWPIRWAQWSPVTSMEARPAVTLAALLTLRAYNLLPG